MNRMAARKAYANVNRFLKLAWVALLIVGARPLAAQEGYFNGWPAGSSPQEVGKRVAEHFVTSPHQYSATIHYSEACAWYGALTFAALTHDEGLRRELVGEVRTPDARRVRGQPHPCPPSR